VVFEEQKRDLPFADIVHSWTLLSKVLFATTPS
jgi:hypothetical protein